MTERCSGCGVEASENLKLKTEGLPVVWQKRYCPKCLERYNGNISLVVITSCWAALIIGFVIVGRQFWYSPIAAIFGFVAFSASITIPHEFAHAIAARLVGFSDIRIEIGEGDPFYETQALGFPWMFRRVPFSGRVRFERPKSVPRWKIIVTAGSGPAVSALLIGIVWLLLRTDPQWWRFDTLSGSFLWSNILALISNLMPDRVIRDNRAIANDGLAIVEQVSPKTAQAVVRLSSDSGLLKWRRRTFIALAGLVTIGCAVTTTLIIAKTGHALTPDEKVFAVAIFLGLTLGSAACTWWVFRQSTDA